jgi:hypothetical protein
MTIFTRKTLRRQTDVVRYCESLKMFFLLRLFLFLREEKVLIDENSFQKTLFNWNATLYSFYCY